MKLFLIATLLLTQTLSLLASTGGVRTSSHRSTTDIRSAMADREMRSYRNRLEREKNDARTREGFQSQTPGYGFSLNKNSGTASTIFFYDDMESGTNGWTIGIHTDSAVWHQSTSNANSPTHSWWPGIEGQGNYNTNTRVAERLISPTIDLSGAIGSTTLLFSENYVTERGWDFCMVDVSTDGGTTWTHLRGGYGTSPSGDSRGWIVSLLDLTPYANQLIKLSFFFDTGDSLFNSFPGWFVDNVTVFDQSGTISGAVYYDLNQNGLRDTEESGLPDRTINVTGPINLTAKTNEEGNFGVLLPLGSYQVSEIIPPPWSLTSSPSSWNIDLSIPDQAVGDVLFGNYRSGSVLRGTVFNDVDRDSVFDGGEPPLVNQYVELTDSNDNVETETYSDSSGIFNLFLFDSGIHHVLQYLDGPWVSTIPGENPAQYTVNVPPVDTLISGLLFGSYYNPAPLDSGIIRGYVFNDLDHDRLQGEREPLLPQRVISLSNGNGLYDETLTDSVGSFSFRNLAPETYIVRLGELYRWQQSYPDSFYSITLTNGELKDSVVFGSYELPTGTVRGTVFEDLNRNGQRDSLDAGLEGWMVSAKGPGSWSVDASTDSAGNYALNEVVEGDHLITISLRSRWGQSAPPGSSYSITLGALETRDSLDFGVYALNPGSITGTLFDDVNGNAVRDSGEPGIAGGQLRIDGQLGTVSTNDSGQFHFNGLWPGSYTVRLSVTPHRRQTFPPSLLPQFVTLGTEEDRTGVDFGTVFDSAFNTSFRTFLPESIALSRDSKGKLSKSEKKKPYASEATFDLTAPIGDLTGLHVVFSQDILPGSLTVSPFPPPAPSGQVRTWDFTLEGGATLASGDHIVIFARGNKPKPLLITKYWWIKGAENPALGTNVVRSTTGNGRLLLRMPNAINMIEELYKRTGGLSALTVGLGGAHSVYHFRPTDVVKSFIDKHGMHAGPPRCLGVYATNLRPITKPVKSLSPTKGNNKLFAELLALKVNLNASELWVTPSGLGYLIFREATTNRFNDRTIYQIAGSLDSAMSDFNPTSNTCVRDDDFFNEAFRTVRMIDSAFSGPFDTTSYQLDFSIKPSRDLSGIPYLHIDSSFSGSIPPRPRGAGVADIPLAFQLAQNYPNPFNPTTVISFQLPVSSLVTIKIYNILGQEVLTLLERQEMDDGDQEVEFNASNLPSGVYFYRLEAAAVPDEDEGIVTKTYMAVRKMVLLR